MYGARPWAQWTLDPSLVAPYGGGPKACWVLGPSLELQHLTLSLLDWWPRSKRTSKPGLSPKTLMRPLYLERQKQAPPNQPYGWDCDCSGIQGLISPILPWGVSLPNSLLAAGTGSDTITTVPNGTSTYKWWNWTPIHTSEIRK